MDLSTIFFLSNNGHNYEEEWYSSGECRARSDSTYVQSDLALHSLQNKSMVANIRIRDNRNERNWKTCWFWGWRQTLSKHGIPCSTSLKSNYNCSAPFSVQPSRARELDFNPKPRCTCTHHVRFYPAVCKGGILWLQSLEQNLHCIFLSLFVSKSFMNFIILLCSNLPPCYLKLWSDHIVREIQCFLWIFGKLSQI